MEPILIIDSKQFLPNLDREIWFVHHRSTHIITVLYPSYGQGNNELAFGKYGQKLNPWPFRQQLIITTTTTTTKWRMIYIPWPCTTIGTYEHHTGTDHTTVHSHTTYRVTDPNNIQWLRRGVCNKQNEFRTKKYMGMPSNYFHILRSYNHYQ